MPNELKPCPFCGGKAHLVDLGYSWIRCDECEAESPCESTAQKAIEAWNRRATDSKSSIDFDKIATSFHLGQIEGYMQELNYTRECALLYLWFYNNVSVNWLADVKRNNGRGMYRKFAEAISNRILEK